jgi:hypothetical protein
VLGNAVLEVDTFGGRTLDEYAHKSRVRSFGNQPIDLYARNAQATGDFLLCVAANVRQPRCTCR